MRSAARALVALALAAALVAAPSAAGASVGSVPAEVRAYVTGGALADRLADIYGENADGEGIPFDETTEPGAISRVFHWTDARLAGDVEGDPVQMVNEWAVPVSLDEQPVGVAIIWINLDTDLPELAELLADPDAAVALAEVPAAAELVRDLGSGAWFALQDDTATPLVAGTSQVTGPTPVDELALATPEPADSDVADSGAGIGVAIAAVVVLLGVVVVALLLPGRRRRILEEEGAPEGGPSDPPDEL